MLLLLLLAVIVVVDPRNPPWKSGKNRVGNSWDIADVEFPVVGGGWWCKVIFVSHPTFELSWGWVGVVTILHDIPLSHPWWLFWLIFHLANQCHYLAEKKTLIPPFSYKICYIYNIAFYFVECVDNPLIANFDLTKLYSNKRTEYWIYINQLCKLQMLDILEVSKVKGEKCWLV